MMQVNLRSGGLQVSVSTASVERCYRACNRTKETEKRQRNKRIHYDPVFSTFTTAALSSKGNLEITLVMIWLETSEEDQHK